MLSCLKLQLRKMLEPVSTNSSKNMKYIFFIAIEDSIYRDYFTGSYLLLYRAGWEISLAPLMVNVSAALILIALGVGLYNESLTIKQGIGIIFCLIGFFLVRM